MSLSFSPVCLRVSQGGGDFSGQIMAMAASAGDPRLGLGWGSESAAGPDLQTRPAPGLGRGSESAAGPDLQTGPARAGVGRHCQWPRLLGPSRKRGARRLPPATGAAGSKRNVNTGALEKRQCHDKECGDSGICSHGVRHWQQARAAAQVRVPVMILKIYSSNKGPGR